MPALSCDDEGQDLLGRLLCWSPERRISARDALEHPWLRSACSSGGSGTG